MSPTNQLEALARSGMVTLGTDQEGQPNYRCTICSRMCVEPQDHARLCPVKMRLQSPSLRLA